MATRKTAKKSTDRSRVKSTVNVEVKKIADELGVSTQAINGARRATGSNDRSVIAQYIAEKQRAKIKIFPVTLT